MKTRSLFCTLALGVLCLEPSRAIVNIHMQSISAQGETPLTSLFVVQRALGRNNPEERSFRSSERKLWAFLWCLGCNVVVLSLLVAFRTKTGEEPSRSFEDLRGEPQTFGEPSRSFEFLRGPSRDPHKTFGEPSRSFGGLQDKPSRNIRDPSSSFEVLRKASKRSFALKMGKSKRKRPLQPEWSQFAQNPKMMLRAC